jgi:hypothetical protein
MLNALKKGKQAQTIAKYMHRVRPHRLIAYRVEKADDMHRHANGEEHSKQYAQYGL